MRKTKKKRNSESRRFQDRALGLSLPQSQEISEGSNVDIWLRKKGRKRTSDISLVLLTQLGECVRELNLETILELLCSMTLAF